MAGRYGQVTGRAAVVTATLGPGTINMQLGVADATTNSSPMVAMFAPVTAGPTRCRPHRRCSARPFKLAETERPAAVYLAIPNARCSTAVNASRFARAASRCSVTFGSLSDSASMTRSYWAATESASGWSNTECSRLRTHGPECLRDDGHEVGGEWVRQRCQAAPGRVAPIAATGPAWASEVTRLTPELPLAVNVHQNASPRRPRR
jgi:Thiamine pyrophosphate enzyme, N-terminal TPP binding domain